MRRLRHARWRSRWVLGLLVLAAWLQLAGYDAGAALGALWRGAFGRWYALTSATLVRAVPLIIIGLGIALAFRAGALNIGAEGQFYAGAIAATWVGAARRRAGRRRWPIAAVLAGARRWRALAGSLVPVWLKLRFGVLEVISTLLLNFVAEALVSLMVQGPLQESQRIYPQSDPIAERGPAAAPARHPAARRASAGARCWRVGALVLSSRGRSGGSGFAPSGAGSAGRGGQRADRRAAAWRPSRCWSRARSPGSPAASRSAACRYALFQNLSPGLRLHRRSPSRCWRGSPAGRRRRPGSSSARSRPGPGRCSATRESRRSRSTWPRRSSSSWCCWPTRARRGGRRSVAGASGRERPDRGRSAGRVPRRGGPGRDAAAARRHRGDGHRARAASSTSGSKGRCWPAPWPPRSAPRPAGPGPGVALRACWPGCVARRGLRRWSRSARGPTRSSPARRVTLGAVGLTGAIYRAAFGAAGAGLDASDSRRRRRFRGSRASRCWARRSSTSRRRPTSRLLAVPVVWWALFRTRPGLALRAAGESRGAWPGPPGSAARLIRIGGDARGRRHWRVWRERRWCWRRSARSPSG